MLLMEYQLSDVRLELEHYRKFSSEDYHYSSANERQALIHLISRITEIISDPPAVCCANPTEQDQGNLFPKLHPNIPPGAS